MPAKQKRADKPAEVLTNVAHGPDGQMRFAGDAPAPEWYADDQAWFLEDLRSMDPPRLVSGDAAAAPAGTTDVELAASGDRGRGDGR